MAFSWNGKLYLEPGDPGFSGHPDDVRDAKTARAEMEAVGRAQTLEADTAKSTKAGLTKEWVDYIARADKAVSMDICQGGVHILKKERVLNREAEARLAERLDARIDALDSTELLRSSAHAVMQANLSAVREHVRDLLHRKSRLVSGTVPKLLTGVVLK